MNRKVFFNLLFISLMITSCSFAFNQQDPAVANTPHMQATNTRWVFKYETETRMPTSTLYSTKTPSLTPSNTPTKPTSTHTLTPTDVNWDDVPKLSELILTTDELSTLELYATFSTKFRLTDITDELVDDCQLDCVKTKYTHEDGSVIMMMIRTKSHEQAERISANFRESFWEISYFAYDYTGVSDMVKEENLWMIMSYPYWDEKEYFFTDYAGMAYGDVVILMVHKQIFCFNDPEVGYVCGDDTGSIACDTSSIFSKQVDKLRAAGYPE